MQAITPNCLNQWNVVGVQTFDVHQFIAAVARAILLLSVFDCIQRGSEFLDRQSSG